MTSTTSLAHVDGSTGDPDLVCITSLLLHLANSSMLLSAMAKRNLELLKTLMFSDFTIECGEQSFTVHRSMLYRHSSFLDVCIEGAFRVSDVLTQLFQSRTDNKRSLATIS